MSAKYEGLSALMDAETGELETRRVLQEVEKDPEMGERWRRYHLASALMKQRRIETSVDLSADIMAQIDSEDASSTQTPVSAPHTERSAWWQGGASMAVAASVTLAVMLGVQHFSVGDQPQVHQPVQAGLIERLPVRSDILPTSLTTNSDLSVDGQNRIALIPLANELSGLIRVHSTLQLNETQPTDWTLQSIPEGYQELGSTRTLDGSLKVFDGPEGRLTLLVSQSGVQGPEGALFDSGVLAFAQNIDQRFVSVVGAPDLEAAKRWVHSVEVSSTEQ